MAIGTDERLFGPRLFSVEKRKMVDDLSHYRDKMLRTLRQSGLGSGVGTAYTEALAVPYIFIPGPI
jgi:hypothetical protein